MKTFIKELWSHIEDIGDFIGFVGLLVLVITLSCIPLALFWMMIKRLLL